MTLEEFASSATPTGLARIEDFCRLGARRIGVNGMAVTFADEFGILEQIFATDVLAGMIADLEFTLEHGPAHDALASSRPVEASDLSAPAAFRRWPLFAPETIGLGVNAVQAFPMATFGSVLGVVSMYRFVSGPLTGVQHRQALAVTELINFALVDPDTRDNIGLGLRMSVHQAAGMVMQQTGSTIVDALALLKATAFSENRPIDELADEVIRGGRRFRQMESHHDD